MLPSTGGFNPITEQPRGIVDGYRSRSTRGPAPDSEWNEAAVVERYIVELRLQKTSIAERGTARRPRNDQGIQVRTTRTSPSLPMSGSDSV